MNPRLPYNPYRVPMPNNLARPAIRPLGPTNVRFTVPFDQKYGHFGSQLATRFHYLSTNIAAKVDQQYIPVEISIVEFSFQEGVTRSYHKILKHNKIPTGLSYDCTLQQLKHRINVEANSEQASKMNGVFGEIADFFNQSPVMIMFCEDHKLEQNIDIINGLKEKHREHNVNCNISVRIYAIQQLANHFFASSGSTMSSSNLSRLMQKAFFDSYLNKQCHYHHILQSNQCTEDDAHKVAYAFLFAMAVIYQMSIDSLPIPNFVTMKPFLEKIAQRYDI